MNKNMIELTGTISKLYRMKTKAGGTMTKVLLNVGKDGTFWVLAYGNIAEAIQGCDEGAPLAISGTAQMNNWKTDIGEWRNDFNAVAWSAEINGQQIKYEKPDQPAPPPPDDRDLSQYNSKPGGYF